MVDLNAIVCPTDTTCFAVGDSAKESTTTFVVTLLIEKWNGSKWSIVPSPVPKGTSDVRIVAISCSSASDCFAVGGYSATTATPFFSLKPLVEHWNGTRWSIVTVPSPAGSLDATLNGVSCVSATSCFAVGDYASPGTAGTLSERWNGAVWSIVATPVTSAATTSGSVPSRAHPSLISEFGTSPGLSDVSCTSDTNCYAVGNAFNRTLVEQWDGASWTIVGSQSPHGADASEFNAVSCAGPSDCSAVGDSFTASGSGGLDGSQDALAEHFDGTSWTIVRRTRERAVQRAGRHLLPDRYELCRRGRLRVGAALGRHELVDHAVRREDVAERARARVVPEPHELLRGRQLHHELRTKSLIEHWNGSSWSIMTSPAPPSGAFETRLNGVSCVSSTNCFAVGAYSTDTAEKALTEHWNGKRWSIVVSPNPPSAEVADLIGVTCPNVSNCTAVGITLGRKAAQTLVEHWNGKRWSIVATPNPKGALLIELIGVSCPGPTDCTAVGVSDSITGRSISVTPLVEHWNGKTWTIVANPPTSRAAFSSLTAVSCPTTTNCIAVGSQESATDLTTKSFAEHWNGTAWSIVAPANPKGATQVSLSDVSCRSGSSCYAVGASSTASAGKTLVEHWNGTAWSVAPSANPAGATNAVLTSVSCPSRTSLLRRGQLRRAQRVLHADRARHVAPGSLSSKGPGARSCCYPCS